MNAKTTRLGLLGTLLLALAIPACSPDAAGDEPASSEAALGAQGRLDVRFGQDGTAPIAFDDAAKPGVSNAVGAMLPKADGTTLLAGIHGLEADPGAYPKAIADELVLARIDKNGALDAAFGTAGIVRVSLDATDAKGHPVSHHVHAMAEQPDGKILVLASYVVASGCATLVLRFDATGALDATFGAGGTATVHLDGKGATEPRFGMVERPRALALDAAGNVLVVGDYVTGAKIYLRDELSPTANIVRLGPTGTVDTTFVPDVTDQNPGDKTLWGREGSAIAIQPDGKILLAGTDRIGWAAHVFRLGPDGKRDKTFGGGSAAQAGVASLHLYEIGAMSVDAAGHIWVAGSGETSSSPTRNPNQVRVERLDASGKDDATFATGGLAKIDVGPATTSYGAPSPVSVLGLSLRADGRIVVGGAQVSVGRETSFVAVRLRSDATPDPTFGDGGVLRSAYGQVLDVTEQVTRGSNWDAVTYTNTVQSAWGAAFAAQPDGRLLFAGNSARVFSSEPRYAPAWSTLLRRFR